jgi:hypothetical protein
MSKNRHFHHLEKKAPTAPKTPTQFEPEKVESIRLGDPFFFEFRNLFEYSRFLQDEKEIKNLILHE